MRSSMGFYGGFAGIQRDLMAFYPLVNSHITNWTITMLSLGKLGKTHYSDGQFFFSIANCESLPFIGYMSTSPSNHPWMTNDDHLSIFQHLKPWSNGEDWGFADEPGIFPARLPCNCLPDGTR